MPTRIARKLDNLAKDLAYHASQFKGYDQERKAKLAAVGRAFLKKIANDVLGLDPGEYDLRFNPGGIAVSGEVTLHTDHHYIQISVPTYCTHQRFVLCRTCEGRKDYTGGRNHQLSPSEVERFLTPVEV